MGTTVTSLACFLLENRCGRVETGGGIVVLMRGWLGVLYGNYDLTR
jgi:hypothetical protein